MNIFDIFEGQPITRRCSVKATKRLAHRADKLGAQFNEREQRKKIPHEIAWECSDEDLLLLLEEHPRWLSARPALLAEDFLGQMTIASLLRRHLIDLLAPMLEEDWYKRRQKLYEPDDRTWTAEDHELYLFLKAEPGRLHRPHVINVLQLIVGQLTLASLLRSMQ